MARKLQRCFGRSLQRFRWQPVVARITGHVRVDKSRERVGGQDGDRMSCDVVVSVVISVTHY